MSHILTIVNQKGGVGKTTTAVNLSACLASSNRRTLLVDTDPQGNATSALGVDKHSLPLTIYDLLLGDPLSIDHVILNPLLENLYLLPANVNLIGAEVELLARDDRERALWRLLQPIAERFDYIIIDAPPSLGILTINAMTSATSLIIPVQCEYYALEGLSLLMETLRRVRGAFNPNLRLLGLVMTMFDARTNLSRQVTEDVRRHFGNLVFQTIISRSVRLSEAPSYGKPIILYDPHSAGADGYTRLSREVMARLETEEVLREDKPKQPDDTNISPIREVNSENSKEESPGAGA